MENLQGRNRLVHYDPRSCPVDHVNLYLQFLRLNRNVTGLRVDIEPGVRSIGHSKQETVMSGV